MLMELEDVLNHPVKYDLLLTNLTESVSIDDVEMRRRGDELTDSVYHMLNQKDYFGSLADPIVVFVPFIARFKEFQEHFRHILFNILMVPEGQAPMYKMATWLPIKVIDRDLPYSDVIAILKDHIEVSRSDMELVTKFIRQNNKSK